MAILNSITSSGNGNTDNIVAAFKQFCIESYVVGIFTLPTDRELCFICKTIFRKLCKIEDNKIRRFYKRYL